MAEFLCNHRYVCLTSTFLILPEGIFSEVGEHSILSLTYHLPHHDNVRKLPDTSTQALDAHMRDAQTVMLKTV